MPRKDWAESRRRLTAAALELGAERGAEFALDEVAQRAGLASSTLYRHFPHKGELVIAMLDVLIEPVQENAAEAETMTDPGDAFRHVLTHGCGMTPEDVSLFARLADQGSQPAEHASALVIGVVAGVAARLRAVGRLRPGIADDDLALFVRMVELADTPERRAKTLDLLLDGLVLPPPAAA